MELQIIQKQDYIPEFDNQAIQVQYMEFGRKNYSSDKITENLISKFLKQIPSGMDAILYLDPDGEDNWMEVLCDGEWLALGFSGDFGENNYYSYNPAFAGKPDMTKLKSGGQSPVEKMLAIQDVEAGVRAVEYFIRTGGFYPGIDWAKQL